MYILVNVKTVFCKSQNRTEIQFGNYTARRSLRLYYLPSKKLKKNRNFHKLKNCERMIIDYINLKYLRENDCESHILVYSLFFGQ